MPWRGAFSPGTRAWIWTLAALLPAVVLAAATTMEPEAFSDDPLDPGATAARRTMVEKQVRDRGIADEAVLQAMEAVPRHLFVPTRYRDEAYADHPLPIGNDQTISQPYIVALMTALVRPTGEEKVLEVGTGSGYHAAVMSRAVAEVFSIEIVPELGRHAGELLSRLGYENVHVRVGDGYHGWPEEAPFDAIVLTAAPREVPRPLLEQLGIGGRMVLPLGTGTQELVVITRTEEGFDREVVAPVRFVPMTGEALADTGR